MSLTDDCWFGWSASRYPLVNQHSNGKWTRIEDVFPIENLDIPTSYVSKHWRVFLSIHPEVHGISSQHGSLTKTSHFPAHLESIHRLRCCQSRSLRRWPRKIVVFVLSDFFSLPQKKIGAKNQRWLRIGCFPKIISGVENPPNHPLKHWVFHYFHHTFWGTVPLFSETPRFVWPYLELSSPLLSRKK